MNCFVYVLKSKKDKFLYIGISSDPERRLKEHNSGHTKSTKGRIPFELVYSEVYNARIKAREREKYFKSGSGREHLKTIIDI